MKKTTKRIVILFALVLMMIFATMSAFAANDEGISFSSSSTADKWHMRKPLEDAPYSFETWIKVPTTVADSTRVGYLFSNYDGGSGTSTYYGNDTYGNRTISLEILAGGSPQLMFGPNKSSGGLDGRASIKFDQVDVRTGEWMHLAIVKEADRVVCYVNGEEKQSVANSQTYYKDDILQPYAFGADNRSKNTYYFRGSVKGFTAYKDVRTAEEIKSSYIYGVKTSDVNMILHYDLTTVSSDDLIIKDLTGNGYDLKKKAYDGYVPSASDIGAKGTGSLGSGAVEDTKSYDYSFAIVGDTQYITSWDTAYIDGVKNENTHLDILYDWILANKDARNIQYVMGLGDITDKYNVKYNGSTTGASHDTAAEWAWAYEQISRLNGEIPYSVVRGNHDNEKYFDQYFANDSAYISQFNDPDYDNNDSCFYAEGSVLNAYTKFTVGTENYLLLLLDYDPSDAVLEWAYKVIERNRDYRVIITTHSYLNDDKTLTSTGGDDIWEKIVKDNENVVLVLCGHVISSNIVKNEREGSDANAVTEILINPQSRDGQYKYDTKAGMVAMLYFSNGGKDVRVEYISTVASTPEEDVYGTASANNFELKLMNTYFDTKYGRMTSEYADADKYPFVAFGADGTFIGAYESLLDCTSPYDNNGAIYASKNYLSANVWSEGSYGDNPRKAIIWVRRDYALLSNESYNNMAQTKGTIVIDLDGHSLTVSNDRALFPSTIKPWGEAYDYRSEFAVENGTIILGSKQLISFSASQGTNGYDMTTKEYVHSFTNVKFVASSTTTNFFAGYSSSVAANPSAVFNDCIFDFSNAPADMVMFNLGNSYIHTSVTVNGGEIISNGNSIVPSKNGTDTSKLTFGKTENGNYTTLSVPKDSTLPITKVNGGDLVFVKVSEGTETEIYRLRPASVSTIDYAPKMSITLETQIKINVYIPVESTVKFTFDGKTYENTDVKNIDGKSYYVVGVSLPSASAARDMKLVATVDAGETTAIATFTFSVPKYAVKVLNNASASDVEKALIKDVLAYVQSAYNYFTEFNTPEEIARVNDLVNELLAVGGDYSGEIENFGNTTDNTDLVSLVTLNLGDKPTIRFYVNVDGIEFFVNGEKLNTVAGTDATYGNYVELDVYAYVLSETITYSKGDMSGEYHITSYLEKTMTDETLQGEESFEDLLNLISCFIKYTESAASYRRAVIGA